MGVPRFAPAQATAVQGKWQPSLKMPDASGHNNPLGTCHKYKMASSGLVGAQRPSETKYIVHIPSGPRTAAREAAFDDHLDSSSKYKGKRIR
jgi:hypothetical protein